MKNFFGNRAAATAIQGYHLVSEEALSEQDGVEKRRPLSNKCSPKSRKLSERLLLSGLL